MGERQVARTSESMSIGAVPPLYSQKVGGPVKIFFLFFFITLSKVLQTGPDLTKIGGGWKYLRHTLKSMLVDQWRSTADLLSSKRTYRRCWDATVRGRPNPADSTPQFLCSPFYVKGVSLCHVGRN